MWNHIQLDKWILACNDFIASIGLTNTHVFIFDAIVLVRRSMDGRRQKEYCMIAFHFVNTFFGSKNSLSLFQLRFIGMSHHLHILAVFFSMTNPLTNPIRDRLENCLALLSSKLSETFVKFRSTEKWFKLVSETWYTHYQRVCKFIAFILIIIRIMTREYFQPHFFCPGNERYAQNIQCHFTGIPVFWK